MIKCRKVIYATKKAAKFVVKRLKANGDKRKLRIYLCEDCLCWHTSAYTANDIRGVKDRRFIKLDKQANKKEGDDE